MKIQREWVNVEMSEQDCEMAVAWVAKGGPAFQALGNCRWLLAHCDSGVCWGLRNGGGWELGADWMELGKIQQLRIFGRDAEGLVWWDGARMQGRIARDKPDGGSELWLKAKDEEWILLGNRRLEGRGKFTLVGDETGACHVAPAQLDSALFAGDRWPLRMRVRHYFEQDPETGVVRVGASRLVDVYVKGR